MKRIIAMLLAALLLVGCGAQPTKTQPTVADLPITFGATYTDCDCRCLQLKGTGYQWEEGTLSLNVNWINQTLDEGCFGVNFTLEQKIDDEWIFCPVKSVVFIAIGCILTAGQTRPETYPITDHYALTEPGLYRIGTTCYLAEREVKLWLEFTVGETQKPTESLPPSTELEVRTQYVRTNGGWDDYDFPQTRVIPTADYLNDYYEENKEIFNLEKREHSGASMGFLDVCERYDAAFFEENYLVFVILEEGSGSVSHEVSQVLYTGYDQLSISVDRLVPEVGTDDMAAWHMILEIPRQYSVTEIDVLLYVDGTLLCGQPPKLDSGLFVRTKPPKMQLRNSEGTYEAVLGSYYWDHLVGENTRSSVIADANVAYYCYGTPFAVTDGTMELQFEEQPDSITVIYWPDDVLLPNADVAEMTMEISGNTLQLLDGGYIYSVKAKWDEDKRDYFGSAEYNFYAVLQPPHEHTVVDPSEISDCLLQVDPNVVTSIYGDRQQWAITLNQEDSVALAQILLDVVYTPETCRCMAEHLVKTDYEKYEINLTEGFARCDNVQGVFTPEQLQQVTEIVNRARENAQKEG